MRRKGELSPARIDREWPHQIVLKASDCTGQNNDTMLEFCEDLSLCPRGHSYIENDEWMRVFCFANREHAERFRQEFEGAWFDPTRRRSGRGWTKLKPPRQKHY